MSLLESKLMKCFFIILTNISHRNYPQVEKSIKIIDNLTPKESCQLGKACVSSNKSPLERKRELSIIFPGSDKKKLRRNVTLQINRAEAAKEVISNGSSKKVLAESKRKVIDEVCHEYCRLNTSTKVSVGAGKEPHYLHERLENVQEFYDNIFLESQEYKDWLQHHDDQNICFSTFRSHICPCVKKVEFKNCVDELELEILEGLWAAKDVHRNKCRSCNCNYCTSCRANKISNQLRDPLASVYGLMSHLCCDEVPFPSSSPRFSRKMMFQKSCCFGTCLQCQQTR